MNEPQTNEQLQARLETLEAREQRRAKRTRLLLAAGIVSALATPFAARALGAVPHLFSAGAPIVAADINANFAHVVAGVTAVEARATALEARRSGPLYCGSTGAVGGQFSVATFRGYAAARELCRARCGASPTAHMCTAAEASVSYQLGVLPVGTSAETGIGWVTGTELGRFNTAFDTRECEGWTSSSGTVFGTTWDTRAATAGPGIEDCSGGVRAHAIYCCD